MSTRHVKLWGGRFGRATDPLVECYTSSIAVDHRLAKYDVVGSIAHAKMLGATRIIPAKDAARIVRGLTGILRLIERNRFRPDPSAEDIHTQIQQMLQRAIGGVAEKLHTARSRNDQVVLDVRLYCRDAVARLQQGIRQVQRALVALARANREVIIPGYTHLQRAQPVLLAHHLLAYVEMLERDHGRLGDALKRINVLPLGACALAGTTLPIDRASVARLLKFPRVSDNSLDAVSDRDFIVELVSHLALVAVHLSRFSEDGILWATEEFGILQLDDSIATGSSMMPQKKNPDVLELIRGQSALVSGAAGSLLTLLKGLPLAYNRDLQWDKHALFQAVDLVQSSLEVLARVLGRVRIRRARALELASSDSLGATDLAEYLIKQGVSSRAAHRAVGQLVAFCERQGTSLRGCSVAQMQRFSPQFDRRAKMLLDPRKSVAAKQSAGSTNPQQVARALSRWQARLGTRSVRHFSSARHFVR